MGKLLKITLIGVALALLGERIAHFMHRNVMFREIEPVELPNCQLLNGIEYGSEDIEILPNGLAFISSGLKYPGMFSFAPNRPGEIFLLDLNDEHLRPSSLRISRGFDLSSFSPHGLSIYIDENDDTVYLFVVNHPHISKSTVEIFKFVEDENVLVHLKTIKHAALYSVNDIVAVGPESFYATNDHYVTDFILRFVEMLVGLRWTNVVYYSPSDVREVATGFYSANGIAMSNDKRFIYVADVTGKTINVLEKHANWSLSPVKVLQLEALLDNLSVDPITGDIWTGAHPNGLKLFKYSAEDPPGSEVIRVQNIHSDNPVVTTVYANDGSVLQGSTCANVWEKNLLVGTVFHKALHCKLE
ncbi:PREDICTED: serum paraoxonase/arylesterase 2-like [Nanorana parkeri]|uniref:serum paraoxonase/arylesterase 2-like n=1 Tax=Nanorana parkeri TaxID=125878 RepID=UPI000854C88E|nr:PREDICTED: serum paraoxonase/arylesterase 2-like [Nanorana parkeri]